VNHAPTANAGPDDTRNEGAAVTLAGSGTDPDSDPLTYAWVQIGGPIVILSGATSATPSFTAPQLATPQLAMASETLTFELTVNDGYGGIGSDTVVITVLDTNAPPNCTLAQPSLGELWPPNHRLVPVSILGVTDAENSNVTITILSVTQDEPINGLGDGDTAPDAVIQGTTVLLRAERSGTGNGRVYRVTFEASDGNGGVCTGQVSVTVPHSKGRNASPVVDDGQGHSSLGN
jgi:hypothetical protein